MLPLQVKNEDKNDFFSLAFSRSTMVVNLQLGEMSAAYERPITVPGMRHQRRLMRLWEKQQVRRTAVRPPSLKRRTGMKRTMMSSDVSVASTKMKALWSSVTNAWWVLRVMQKPGPDVHGDHIQRNNLLFLGADVPGFYEPCFSAAFVYPLPIVI